jgi:membrane-associated protein
MVHLDLASLIRTIGLLGVAGIVFTESGLLIGLFLPGDSLLFTAGLLAAQGYLDIRWLVLACFAAAVAGDQAGYAFGLRVGRALFQRQDSRFFKKRYLVQAERFFLRHGGKAVTLARFVPIVRTCTPIVAGIGRMPYQRFLAFNLLGAALWAIGITLAGYWLGNVIPGIDRYLLPIVVAIVLVSLAPSALHLWRERQATLPHPPRAGAPLPAKERDRT